MMKNDITYEYRVFTNRLVDVESMEVGRCTSKSIKELKSKDKINGRFFHTSDTDEWYFCWDGELQKLNLKGNSDVNAALNEVKTLIANANVAVDEAKATAKDAKAAADKAQAAADAAGDAVESIDSKADKSAVEAAVAEIAVVSEVATAAKGVADEVKVVVEAVSKDIEAKADNSVVETLSQKVDTKADASTVKALEDRIDEIKVPSLDGYATEDFVSTKIEDIKIPVVPANVSSFTNDAGYLTAEVADAKYAPIGGSDGVDLSGYATKEFVGDEIKKINIPTKVSELDNDKNYLTEHQDITGKQDVITDLGDIRSGAALGKTALQKVPSEYITESELNNKGYLTEQSLNGYATKTFVNEEIGKIDIPKIPSLDGYATKAWVGEQGFLTEHQDITGKQDVITDLGDIRSKAMSAIQVIPAEYVTDDELTAKGYLTEHQSLDNYYTKDEIDEMLTGINDLIGEATNITNTILA